MVFYPCCVCAYEGGLDDLVLKESWQEKIEASPLPRLYARLVAPYTNADSSTAEKNYAYAAKQELLEDGTVKDCAYLCKKCKTKLHEPDSCPKNAIVNGHFKGKCPEELKNLSLVELSLISLINVVTKVSLVSNLNYANGGTMFSIINDVSTLVQSLPQRPTIDDFAFIRAHGGDATSRKHRYSPWKVFRALKWLELNNPLYLGKIQIPEGDTIWEDETSDESLPFLQVGADVLDGIDELNIPAGRDGHAVNPGAPPSDSTDVLLMPSTATADISDQVRSILTQGNSQIPPVFNRLTGETVAMHSTDFFIQKAFPHLYPYGRGGPEAGGVVFDAAYIKMVLSYGLGREFQQFPTFLFYCYRWLMHKGAGTIGKMDHIHIYAFNMNYLVPVCVTENHIYICVQYEVLSTYTCD